MSRLGIFLVSALAVALLAQTPTPPKARPKSSTKKAPAKSQAQFDTEGEFRGEIYCGRDHEPKANRCECMRRFAAVVHEYEQACQRSPDPNCLANTPGCSENLMPAIERSYEGESVDHDKMGPLCRRYCSVKNCRCCKS
jgi:hypothetical protein